MVKREYDKICFEIAKQDHAKQAEIMEMLKGLCTDAEYNCLLIGIAYFRMLLYPELKNAIMQSMGKELYTRFNNEVK